MLHFGLPSASIIPPPTQPLALSHLHAAGSVDRQARSAIMAEQRYERSVTGEVGRRLRAQAVDQSRLRQQTNTRSSSVVGGARAQSRRRPYSQRVPKKANLPTRRALVGLGRAFAIGAAVSPLYLVLFSFPISHNGDLHRVRRHHGSCLDWSRRGRRWGRSHRLRSCPADIVLADSAIWIRL